MRKGLVSVIIPTYNRRKTIKRSIDSVINQTYKNLEIIIVDDASTDETFEYISQWYADIDNITYVKNDNNIGPAASRNAGVEYAKGEYVAFHDSDDEWLPEKLEMQVVQFENAGSDVGAVYSAFERRMNDSKRIDVFPTDFNTFDECNGNIYSVLLVEPLVGCITLLMKKRVFQEAGGFNEHLYALEDYEFSIRLARKYKFIYLENVLAISYYSKDGVGTRANHEIAAHCYIMEKYSDSLQELGLMKDKIRNVYFCAKNTNNYEMFLQCLAASDDPQYLSYIKECMQECDA